MNDIIALRAYGILDENVNNHFYLPRRGYGIYLIAIYHLKNVTYLGYDRGQVILMFS